MRADENCRNYEPDLTAYGQGELPDARRAEVEAHLATCAACARAVAEVESVLELAGSVEDLAPSLRFKRNLAALVESARRPAPSGAGLSERIAAAAGAFVERLRTSRGFRWATASVAFHVALLLVISFVVIPRYRERDAADGPREWTSKYTRNPELPDEVATPLPAPLPVPEFEEPDRPQLAETGPFPRGAEIPNLGPIEPVLPPAASPAIRPLASLFAIELPATVKQRRLAACLKDPAAATKAVAKALAWLADSQEEDGTWRPGANGEEYRIGVTSAVLLSFLSDGDSETRGRMEYREVVRRAVDRLLAEQHAEGELAGLIGPARGHYAYNHALATLALVEAYSLDVRRVPPERSGAQRRAILKALRFIEQQQVPEGGWRYGGGSNAAQTDSSVAIFMGMALVSARTARFRVSEATMNGLSDFLRSVTDESGAVGYRFAGDRTGAPHTRTAGVLYLEELLAIAAPVRDRQAALVARDLEDSNLTKDNGLLRFYSALAFRTRGTPAIDRFAGEMLALQRTDGSWSSDRDEWAVFGGDSFLTALNVLTLTSSYRLEA